MTDAMTADTMELRVVGPWDDEPVAPEDRPAPAVSADGFVPKRTVVRSKAALVDLLRRWVDASDRSTIGDATGAGGTAHVLWTSGRDDVVALTAETTRAAVLDLLAHVERAGTGAPWHVRPNAHGVLNHVVWDEAAAAPGWHAYLMPPAAGPRSL